MESSYRHLFDLIESIEECACKGRILPCLALLYTGIDVVSSFDTGGEATKSGFVKWVETYFLKAVPLPCTALDIYGARCAVLHTFTPDSRISRNGEARKLAYAWGKADVKDLVKAQEKTAEIFGMDDTRNNFVSVHLSDLILAFRKALVNYLDEVEMDSERQNQVERAMGRLYCNMDIATVANFLELS